MINLARDTQVIDQCEATLFYRNSPKTIKKRRDVEPVNRFQIKPIPRIEKKNRLSGYPNKNLTDYFDEKNWANHGV